MPTQLTPLAGAQELARIIGGFFADRQWLVVYLIAINLIAFMVFGIDKYKAVSHRFRIRESALILLSLAGGSVGSLAAMLVFRHKIRKHRFSIGIPAILLLQMVIMIIVIKLIN